VELLIYCKKACIQTRTEKQRREQLGNAISMLSSEYKFDLVRKIKN